MPKKTASKSTETTHTHTRQRLVLLDSHAIMHRAYHALPDFASSKGEPTGAIYGLVSMLLAILGELKPDYIVACYDLPGPTYRHEVYKEYKAGRAKTDSDLITQLKRSRDVFTAFGIPMYDKPGFEADDMLGTIVEQILKDKTKKFANIDVVIASGDMDTLQLVSDKRVQVYTLKKGIRDTIMYDEDAVRARFGFGPELLPDYKGLRGDPSDNIIGIKGIGEKTASILIQTFGTIEDMYKVLDVEDKKGKEAAHERFIKAGVTPRIIKLLEEGKEEAEFSKTLATIRRDAPIEFVLPEKPFREAMAVTGAVDRAIALFTELDFRMMGARLKSALSGEKSAAKTSVKTTADISDTSNTPKQLSESFPSGVEADLSPEDLQKTALALWVVDSNLTDPTLDDILNFAQTHNNEVDEFGQSLRPNFAKAKEIIFAELDRRDVRKIYEDIELPVMPIVDGMGKRGVKIDRVLLARLSKDYHVELDKLEQKIWELAGMEFNINSPKQLGEVLFDKLALTAKGLKKTSGGARSTRESELQKLRNAHPVVPLIFEHREFQKLLSTYIDAIPSLLDSDDRLHTRFVQSGSTTGRMASQSPNLQNIPIKTELGRVIRKAFIADKGFVLAALDYSQVELRIAAFLSGDKKLIEIFKSGDDVHTAVAAEVFGVPLAKVDRDMRRRAKIINFGILYGMGVNSLRANLAAGDESVQANAEESDGEVEEEKGGVTRAEAQAFYNAYFEKFSGLASYLTRVKAEAEQKGYTETFFGRRRYFEGIRSKVPFIRAMAERMAINAPIQGTNADIVKIAMKRASDYIEKEGLEKDVFLLLQVHDELVFEMRESVASKVIPEIKKIMESVIDPKDIHGIRCVANSVTGKNWGELK